MVGNEPPDPGDTPKNGDQPSERNRFHVIKPQRTTALNKLVSQSLQVLENKFTSNARASKNANADNSSPNDNPPAQQPPHNDKNDNDKNANATTKPINSHDPNRNHHVTINNNDTDQRKPPPTYNVNKKFAASISDDYILHGTETTKDTLEPYLRQSTPDTSPYKATNDNTIAQSMDVDIDESHNAPPAPEWIPIRIEWAYTNANLSPSITNPEIDLSNQEDKQPTKHNPILSQLKVLHGNLKQHHHGTKLRTSRSNDILTEDMLSKEWSINDVKEKFHYFYNHTSKRFSVTMRIQNTFNDDLDILRFPMFENLRSNALYIEPHHQAMDNIATSAVGWFQGHYPEAFDIAKKEKILNANMKKIFHSKENEYLTWCSHHNDKSIQQFDGKRDFPHVSCYISKPQWKPNNTKKLVTRAIAVSGPRIYRALISKLLTDCDLIENEGKATFVPYDMQYAGPTLFEQYGKILTLQQKVIRDHSHETFLGLTAQNVINIKADLMKIPGVLNIFPTKQSGTQGRYTILTSKDLPQSHLAIIDELLADVALNQKTRKFHSRPRRIKKQGERVQEDLQHAWANQTTSVTRIEITPPPNQWRKPLRHLSSRKVQRPTGTPSKVSWADDKSVGTVATTSSESERIDQLTKQIESLTKQVHALQTENMLNRKARSTIKTKWEEATQVNAKMTASLQSLQEEVKTTTETANDNASNVSHLQTRIEYHQQHYQQVELRQTVLENKQNALETKQYEMADNIQQLKAGMGRIETLLSGMAMKQTFHIPTEEIATHDKRSRETSELTSPEFSGSPYRKSPATKRTMTHPSPRASEIEPTTLFGTQGTELTTQPGYDTSPDAHPKDATDTSQFDDDDPVIMQL